MHPLDMETHGLRTADVIRIESDRSSILAVAQPEDDLKRGCISMAHGWGLNPDEAEDPFAFGSTTSRLSDNVTRCDPISGIPIMSAIPVSVVRVSAAVESAAVKPSQRAVPTTAAHD